MTEFKNNTLSSLLYKSYSKHEITHMDMFNRRSYSVKNEEEFLNKYTRAYTYLTGVGMFDKYLLERTTNIGPVLVDIDLCKKLVEPKPLYTEKKVLTLAKLFQKILKNLLVDSTNLDCFVLEKPGYFKDDGKIYKNGFHLHFPYVWLTQRERYYINTLVQEKTKFILDNAIIGGNWFLYGSKKNPDSKPYLLSYIIEEKRNHVPNTYSAHELIFLLSVRQKEHTVVSKLSFLPDIPEKVIKKTIDFDNHTKKSEEELTEYIEKIPKNIADDYTTWRSIGCALYNETHGEDYGKKLWHSFSQMSEKYDEDECETFWEKMVETKYSIGTIIHFAKQKKRKGPVIKLYL